ncbi:Fc.00g106120.m01.CDS01 [Cosmosporella sp. VM-42]
MGSMKTILLLGGMTADVTVLADLDQMLQHAGSGDWQSFARVYIDPIAALTDKVDAVVVCAIIAHKVARQLADFLVPSGIPLLHISDFVVAYLKSQHPDIQSVGLLGPKITMLGSDDPDFFIGPLERPENGIAVLIPKSQDDIDEVNRGMLEEVAKGAAAVTESTKKMFVRQAKALVYRGAQAIILGSTDLGFVLRQEDLGSDIPIIEPASIHAEGVAKWAIDELEG